MKRSHLKTMTTDELWTLHQEIAMTLAQKMIAEKDVLENRLRQLKKPDHIAQVTKSARVDRTLLYFPNIEILKIRPKLGPGAASSHAG